MSKKYILTTKKIKPHEDAPVLYQIKALINVPYHNIKAGELGGYLESEHNLSQDGNAWVANEALVFGQARVLGNAYVGESATIGDDAVIRDNATVIGHAALGGRVTVRGSAFVLGDMTLTGNEVVRGEAIIGFEPSLII